MSVRNLFDHADGARPSLAPAGLTGAFAQVVDTVLGWQERARQRHHLSQLNDSMLKDIGVTRADVEGEVAKPFWRS